jgi:hypothetical protein
MLIGTQTPNGQSTYAQIEGLDKLVLVDSSWSSVLNRLVTEPPVPEWLYTLNPDQVSEMLLFENNDVVRVYGLGRSTGEFHLCDVPVIDQPCAGSTPVDKDAFEAALGLVADRHVEGVVALDLAEEPDFAAYGTGRNSPYFAISYEQKNDNGVTEVRRVTMSIGDVTPDGAGRYAVANETSDVIRIDKEWGDKLLELFHGPALVAPGATPTTPTATPAP